MYMLPRQCLPPPGHRFLQLERFYVLTWVCLQAAHTSTVYIWALLHHALTELFCNLFISLFVALLSSRFLKDGCVGASLQVLPACGLALSRMIRLVSLDSGGATA
jgi:hypothetical protein